MNLMWISKITVWWLACLVSASAFQAKSRRETPAASRSAFPMNQAETKAAPAPPAMATASSSSSTSQLAFAPAVQGNSAGGFHDAEDYEDEVEIGVGTAIVACAVSLALGFGLGYGT